MVPQKSLKFRPRYFSGKYKIANNPVGCYNYCERKDFPYHYIRVGGHLHYLADHAPRSVNKKWRAAFRRFCKLHPKF